MGISKIVFSASVSFLTIYSSVIPLVAYTFIVNNQPQSASVALPSFRNFQIITWFVDIRYSVHICVMRTDEVREVVFCTTATQILRQMKLLTSQTTFLSWTTSTS